MRGVPEDRAKRDLHAAFDFYPRSRTSRKTASDRLDGAWVEAYSLDVALQEPTLAAAVINYGHLATDFRSAEENQRAYPRPVRRARSRQSRRKT